MNKLFKLLLLSVLLNGLFWIFMLPIWHTPDEQAHFGQVAFVAETGRNPNQNDKVDLTEEIYTSEQLLGTERNNLGNNKFTFHPEYRIEYTDSLIGKYEASISALSDTNAKSKYVIQEATRYPILYYYPASLFYRFFYKADLFTRVYMVRMWSMLLFIGTVFITYKIGKLIFNDEELPAYTLSLLVGFQPMMVFSNIGVNSDAMGNCLFTLFLYSSLRLIIKDFEIINVLLIILVSIISIQTKTQFIIILPIVVMLFLILTVRGVVQRKRWRLFAFFCLVGILTIVYLYKIRFGPLWILFHFLQNFNFSSFIKFTWEYTLLHTYREVMPWYWGVYNWLGVTYPRVVYRIINWMMVAVIAGFGIWLVNIIHNKLWKRRQVQGIFFLLLVSAVYFLGISLYDWLSWHTTKYQLGVQGRYFFSIISVHMLTVILGCTALFQQVRMRKPATLILLSVCMVIFNYYALYIVSSAYYQLWPIAVFIKQASQYKPFFIKGNFILFILVSSFVCHIFLLRQMLQNCRVKHLTKESNLIE